MSICIRHTWRQAFRWFLNKRGDVANAIKLDCRRLHACFRIFYAPFTVALLVHLRLFIPSLTTNCIFRLKIGKEGREKSEIKIIPFIIIAQRSRISYTFANIPFVHPFKHVSNSILDREYFANTYRHLFCSFGLTLMDILTSGFQTDTTEW